MTFARRNPAAVTVLFVVVGSIAVAFLSPEGNLVVPAIAGIGLLVIACFVYRRLSRVQDGR